MPAASRQSERRPSAPTDQRRLQRLAAFERDRHRAHIWLHSQHVILDQPQRAQRAGAAFERFDQMAVLDVVAEGREPDLLGVEFHFRRPPQPAGIVDDAHDFQRRGMLDAELPHTQGGQCDYGTGEQGGGTIIA